MGKLNYSARRICGIKAGQVVSKDLRKKIPPGTGSKAAARDPNLEIDVAGKSLTDEGFAHFIDDLIECIRYRDEEHQTRLAKVTELHVQNNELTIQSLPKLGKMIALSSGDLRELDLSHNNISILKPEDKEIWREFLESFKNCYMLKRLDLGNNPLGPAGLETLARAYIKCDLDYLESDANGIIGTNECDTRTEVADQIGALKIESEKEKENEPPRASRIKKSPNKGKAARQNGHSHFSAAAASKIVPPADLRVYACTRGLRSIPFLILSDIAINNTSAIHLASMLSFQRSPDQLLTFLPPCKLPTVPGNSEGCKSIIWCSNESLTPHAKRLLEIAQTIQEARAKVDSGNEDFDDEEGAAQRKLQGKLELEYARLTKRVRLEFLKQEGVECSEIAVTALRMRNVARALLLDDKHRAEEPQSDNEIAVVEEPYIQKSTSEEVQVSDDMFIEHEYIEHIEYVPPYLVGPFHPNAHMFDEEFPALQMPIHKEEIVDIGAPPESSSSQTPRPAKGIPRYASTSREIRKESWRFGLPFELWRRIIADATGADKILDREQQSRIIQYASDWNAVAYELTIKGAEKHQQIWKFLETVGCFTYTPLS